MGAWGIGPFDNDTALDFITDLVNIKVIKELLNKKPNNTNYDELRATATVIIHLHKIKSLWFDKEILEKLSNRLSEILIDDEWFDSWVDKKDSLKVKKQIKKMISDIDELSGY